MKQKMKQFLGILLTFALLLSMLPGMSLTVYADDPYASLKNSTTVITFDSKPWYLIDYDSSTVTLLAKECVGASRFGSNSTYSGSTVENAVNNYYRNNISAAAKTAVSGSGMFLLNTTGANNITNVEVRKCPTATGAELNRWWLSTRGTDGNSYAAFVDGDDGTVRADGLRCSFTVGVRPALKLDRSSVIFSSNTFTVKHIHDFTYTADGATITATCGAEGCTLDDSTEQHNHTATLTIVGPVKTTYGDANSADATITDANSIKGSATVSYYKANDEGTDKTGEALTGAPTDAGKYWAEITLTNTENSSSATAHVVYTIAKADPTATAPAPTATYGQTLADVTLPEGWTWVDAATTSVGTVGNHTFKADFAGNDNYNAASNVDVTVTVGKATPVISAEDKSVKIGKTVSLGVTVSPNVGVTWGYTSSNESIASVSTDGVVTGVAEGSATITISATASDSANCNNAANETVTITVLSKNPQTITASDVTATYGDTNKSVSGTSSGTGVISYTVTSGSDVIDVNASSGALTIKKAGTATVTVTAAATATGGDDNSGYAQATKDVTVTVNQKPLTIKAKDQSIYVGDTVPTLSGTDFHIVTGLVGEDTLTALPTLAYQKDGNAVTPDNTTAGTYDIVPSGATASDNYTISYTKGTLTISTQSSYSGGGSVSPSTTPTQSGESYNVPIENESSVSVGANISNGTATVNEITDEQIEQATQPTSASGSDSEQSNTLTIDLSGAKQQVTAVEIPEKTVEKLADAATDSGNNIENVAVELSSGGIEFDANAMATISKESTGSVKVEIAEKPASELNASQQASLVGKQTEMVFGVNVSSGNKEIHQFNGNAKVHKNHTATKDKNFYHIEYLPDNGKAQRLISEHTGTQGIYKESHASDYAIVYDENDQNENIKPLSGVTFADTTYTGKPQSIKITGVSADSVDDVKVPADAYEITGVTTQTNAGTYQFTLTAKEGSGFRGATVGTWKINKGKTSFSVKGATVKAKKLKNKKQAVTVKVSNLSTGSLKPTFAIKKVTKGQKKKVKINKKTGKVTLKKGCKKCKITVVATSKANANREKATATAKIVVK